MTINIPEEASACNREGMTSYWFGKYGKAIKSFDKAIKIYPSYASAWNNKGLALSGLNKYYEDDGAIKAFQKAIDLDQEFAATPLYNKGLAFYKLKKYSEAIKDLENATRQRPDNGAAMARKNLALIFFYLGNIKGSYEQVKNLLAKDGKDTDALSLQGRILIENKDYYIAAESFEKAISLDDGKDLSLLLWEAYANYLYIEFSGISKIGEPYQKKENIALIIRKLERAEKLFDKDVKERRAYILYFLGYLYYKIHDIFTAKEKLEECIRLNSRIKNQPVNYLIASGIFKLDRI